MVRLVGFSGVFEIVIMSFRAIMWHGMLFCGWSYGNYEAMYISEGRILFVVISQISRGWLDHMMNVLSNVPLFLVVFGGRNKEC